MTQNFSTTIGVKILYSLMRTEKRIEGREAPPFEAS